jgi:hypothetical protein
MQKGKKKAKKDAWVNVRFSQEEWGGGGRKNIVFRSINKPPTLAFLQPYRFGTLRLGFYTDKNSGLFAYSVPLKS